jgi:hypothetical protein
LTKDILLDDLLILSQTDKFSEDLSRIYGVKIEENQKQKLKDILEQMGGKIRGGQFAIDSIQ